MIVGPPVHTVLVSYLEMIQAPDGPPRRPPLPNAGVAREALGIEPYLDLYRRVGGPPGWDTRLVMTRPELQALLAAATTDLYVLRLAGQAVGFCEISRAGAPAFELCHFGIVPERQGRGLGPYLLDHALRDAWRHRPERIWLHTDEMDHPAAIRVYERAGFRLYKTAREETTHL